MEKIKGEIDKVKKVFTNLKKFIKDIGFDDVFPSDMFKDGVKSALEVETAVKEINRVMGESTNQFANWSKESSLAFNISQSDAMKYGASFSNLVSKFTSDSKETMQYTTDLLEASSIIASGTGRTMEDVMGRITSGLTGNSKAMEELGINVDVGMLKSTEAFKKFANGKSWDELSEETQQQIRLFAILEQTTNNFGSEVSNSTNSALRQLGAVLKDIALNIGSAFLPIMDIVLPILNNFANGLRTITGYAVTFISTISGNDNIYAGFSLSESDISEISNFAERVKLIFIQLSDFIRENNEIIIAAIGGFIGSFAGFSIISNWVQIIEVIKDAFLALVAAISSISIPILAVSALIGLIVGNIIYLWQTNDEFKNSIIEIWSQIYEFISTVWSDLWTIVKEVWDEYGQTLIDNLVEFMLAIQSNILILWEEWINPIITSALEMLTWLWDEHLKVLIESVMELVMNLANAALEIYNFFVAPIVNFLVEILSPIVVSVFNFIVNSIGTKIARISDIFNGLIGILNGIIEFIAGVFTLNWEKAFNGLVDILKGIGSIIGGVLKAPLNIIIDMVNGLIDGLNKLLGFELPGFLGGGVIGFTIPKIPKLARGGVINKATLAIVGEAGKEAVMPLENNTGWITLLADKLASRIPQGSSDNGYSGDLIFMIDGSAIGKVALNQLRKMQRQGGVTLIPT